MQFMRRNKRESPIFFLHFVFSATKDGIQKQIPSLVKLMTKNIAYFLCFFVSKGSCRALGRQFPLYKVSSGSPQSHYLEDPLTQRSHNLEGPTIQRRHPFDLTQRICFCQTPNLIQVNRQGLTLFSRCQNNNDNNNDNNNHTKKGHTLSRTPWRRGGHNSRYRR